jgi:hypothetical protein
LVAVGSGVESAPSTFGVASRPGESQVPQKARRAATKPTIAEDIATFLLRP